MVARLSALLVCVILPAPLWLGRAQAQSRPPRQEVHDRHGHAILHLPPLERDVACAPDVLQSLPRPGEPEVVGAALAPLRTRLDGELQALAQRAVQRGVERLARLRPHPRSGTVVQVRDDELVLDLGGGQRGILPLPPPIACAGHDVPPLEPARARFQAGEVLSVRVVSPRGAGDAAALVALQPQAALVALDPRTRDILALVGGYGQRPYDFDRATQGRRQAGSTWKPLVYAAALQARVHTLADVVDDLPRLYGSWGPRNFSGTYQGPLRLRLALAQSVNTVAVRVLDDVGPGAVAELAGRLGIPAAQVPRDLTQALGTARVSPLQLAGAYAALADTDHGAYAPPRLLDQPAPPPRPALLPAVAYLITSALQSVIEEGTAQRAQELQIPGLAGKTGTTTRGRDAWFVGYHPGLLAIVWIGEDSAADLGPSLAETHRTGSDSALPVWLDFMRGVTRTGPSRTPGRASTPSPWPRPAGLTQVALPGGATEWVLADE